MQMSLKLPGENSEQAGFCYSFEHEPHDAPPYLECFFNEMTNSVGICEDEQSIFTCITYRIVISTGDESPTQLLFVHLYLLQLSNEIVGPNSSLVLRVHMDRKVSS